MSLASGIQHPNIPTRDGYGDNVESHRLHLNNKVEPAPVIEITEVEEKDETSEAEPIINNGSDDGIES